MRDAILELRKARSDFPEQGVLRHANPVQADQRRRRRVVAQFVQGARFEADTVALDQEE